MPSSQALDASRWPVRVPTLNASESPQIWRWVLSLRRVMLDDVGLGPKAFQRVLRLQRFVRLTDQGVRLAAAAAEAGYADQAHASREVLRMAGVPPACLVDERQRADRT